MISFDEIRRSIIGGWRIFLGRADAMRSFDTSSDGFWRSFQAIVPIAPLYALTALADWRALSLAALADDGAPPDVGLFWASKVVLLGLDWVSFPILLAGLSGFLGIRQRYAAFIVVRNWSTILAVAPFGAVAFLDVLGLLPGDAIVIPSLVALGFALRISYMAARIALGATIEAAIGLVVLDFLVSLAIVRTIGRLFGIDAG